MKGVKIFLVCLLLASFTLVGCGDKGGSNTPTTSSASSQSSFVSSDSSKESSYVSSSSKLQEYTINFETKGGTAISPITKTEGSLINKPVDPVLDGCNFVAWCTDEDLTNAVSWPITLSGNMTLYAKYNTKVDIKGLLAELLQGYNVSPLSYIPETMQANFADNLVDKSKVVTDYTTNFVNVNNIYMGGFGEQWNMVLDNLEQSQLFYGSLNIIEGIATTTVAGFNNYIDKNPASTANYSTKAGDYNVTIDFDGQKISYVVDYSISAVAAQISMSMDITSKDKEVRIQLSDANALKYVITENSYEFGIRYGGVRRAFFSISRDNEGNVEGHINEYLSVNETEVTNSAADFYIGEDYVTCVGSKAGGLVGFTGTICEVYNAKTGKMLGYEVRETLLSVQYNTLWFNLSDVSGITNVKTDAEEEIYLNNSSTALVPKTVGGLIITNPKAKSRRYDIEFRTQYFYSYDASSQKYEKIAVSVPMLFVQEEYLETISQDIKETNSYLDVSVNINSTYLEKITTDYGTLVDLFLENLKTYKTIDDILAFIGTKTTFE